MTTAADPPPMLTATPETTERLRACIGRAVDVIHELVRELRVTEPELHALVGFLTSVGTSDEFMLLSDVTLTSILVDALSHPSEAGVTASNVQGPLYRPGAPVIESPAVIARAEQGDDVLVLRGVVRNAATEAPVAGALIDIWQTNQRGLYDIQDPAQPDHNLRGVVRCDVGGGYEVRTVVPGPYRIASLGGPVYALLNSLGRHDWRPAHIHMRVTADGHEPMTTMLFIAGDPWLDDDAIGAVKPELIVSPRLREPATDGGSPRQFEAGFDIAIRPLVGESKR